MTNFQVLKKPIENLQTFCSKQHKIPATNKLLFLFPGSHLRQAEKKSYNDNFKFLMLFISLKVGKGSLKEPFGADKRSCDRNKNKLSPRKSWSESIVKWHQVRSEPGRPTGPLSIVGNGCFSFAKLQPGHT